MASRRPILTRETFQFFKDLSRQNHKEWMDANRDRYQAAIVQPFRRLLEELAPRALELDSRFDTSGRTGPKFSVPAPGKRETGQLYVGLSADAVTVGFRIYSGGKRKESTLALIAEPRVNADSRWVAKQKKRLGRRYESYWYATVKGEWTKHTGWPIAPENWKKILAWIVRRKSTPSAATRASFPREAAKVFGDLYPLLRFTSLPEQERS